MGSFRVERLKVRKQFDPKDVVRVRNNLAARVLEARSQGDEVLVLGVEKICLETGLEGNKWPLICCDILDGDSFAKNHALRYHHRTGAWGTKEAEYTFLVGMGTTGVLSDKHSAWRVVSILLWMAIFALSAAAIWGALVFLLS